MKKSQHQQLVSNFSRRVIEQLHKKGIVSSRSSGGISFKELAKAIDCPLQNARKYVLGLSFPDLESILKIARFLDVSPGWLVFGEEPTPPKNTNTTGVELVNLDYDLLRYILEKSASLFSHTTESENVINFVMDIIYDISHIQADLETTKKIIDISVSSVNRFTHTSTLPQNESTRNQQSEKMGNHPSSS